jgi:hypothetical protein
MRCSPDRRSGSSRLVRQFFHANLDNRFLESSRMRSQIQRLYRVDIPVISDRVHVRCCRRRRLAGCFCARAAKLSSRCDRGQIYCAQGCAQTARHDAQRAAGRRHQASRRGRVNHAARAGRYRARQNNVTHQGSPPHRSDDLVMASTVERASKPSSDSREVARPSPGHCSGRAIARNRWSRSVGTPGRDQSESLVVISRCAHRRDGFARKAMISTRSIRALPYCVQNGG